MTIPPFSLLGPAIDCQEIRYHAAHLCHVKQNQVLDVLPCTPLQAGLLALTQLNAGNYVAKNVFEIDPSINLESFRAAWDQVVAVNPILRTRMVTLPGHGMVQVILDEEVQWVFEDSLELYQRRSLAEESAFGLGDPLTRFALIGGDTPGPRYFVWKIHHALYDGWSQPLILKDAEHTYYRGVGPPLSSMSGLIQYIQGLDPIDVARFWAKLFQGFTGVSFLATNKGLCLDHPQDRRAITRDVSDLKWGRNNFTPTTVVRTAWAAVQASRTNSNEAVFGIRVTGRQGALAGIEHLAGPIIATVPVRVQIDWSGSISQLLESVQCQGTEMIPFEQTGLQNIRRINDETRAACGFQSLLVIQAMHESSADTDNRPFLSEVQDTSNLMEEPASGTYALEIECQLSLSGLNVQIDFDGNVIPPGDVEEILDELQHVLRQLAGFSDGTQRTNRPVASVLPPPKSMSQVSEWNAEYFPPVEETVHAVIKRRARESPRAMAICAWDGEITYHQLDELSTRLAGPLARIPVAGTLVTLLFEKSLWMPVAALAVVKAGGALNALEMKQPEERLREIVAQTNSPLLLCSIQNEKLASKLQPKRLLVVGKNSDGRIPDGSISDGSISDGSISDGSISDGSISDGSMSHESNTDGSNHPPPQLPFVSPASLLYVVFTSGSTGRPKGVQITHRNMRSAITHQQTALQYNEKSRVFDFASYGFDVAWSNLFMTLTAGGCLCIPSAHERENELIHCLVKYDINLMDSTPSLARTLGKEVISRLTTLILGGEAMLPSDALLAGDRTTIVNAYGPAECTPTALISKFHADGVRIGRGYGSCPWIVDAENPSRLVPVGSVGELWLEGPIVGDGYLNDAEKTSAAFIRDPPWLLRHVGRTGLVYRTGDLVRYESDGSLVYIGRKDHQVKIRGQRVELGEIEITLERILRSIRARVVVEVVQLTDVSTLTLVGFVTLPKAGGMTEADHEVAVKQATDGLVDRLAQTLPSYMIPAMLFSLPVVPVTTTGKADRRQLREKARSLLLSMRANEAVQTRKDQVFNSTESVIRDVWAAILNLTEEETSLDVDFARLGGDSITAMQIVSQCRMHNLQLTVSDILQARTIRKLADRCKPLPLQDELTDVLGCDCEDPSVPSELSPIQQDFFSLYPDGLNHYNQSFLLDLANPVSAPTLLNALRAIVSRHPMLRARFQNNPNTGSWQQRIAEDGPGAFAFAVHTVHNKAAASSAAQWRQENLDIREGPVFACDLFNVTSGVQMVLLSAHHLVIDLVSWRIVWGDLEDHIKHGSIRSPQTISFQRWCATQARLGQTLSPLEVLPYSLPDSQLDFWGIPLEENTFDQCESLDITVPEDITTLLFGMSNDSLRTEPVDLMLAALIRGFALTFPERPVPPVWTEAHGREQLDSQSMDVSGTIGWFTAIFPLVVPITSAHSPSHAVRLVKDIRRKVPGKGQPFSSCRAYSESGRRIFGGHDVVELVFNFTGRFQQLEKDDGILQESSSLTDEGPDECDFIPISGSAQRPSLMDLTLGVVDGQLKVSLNVHKRMNLDQIQEWLHHFNKDLEDLCRGLSREPSELTLGDLSISSLSYRGLDTLLQQSLPQLGVKVSSVVDVYPCSALQEGMLLSAMKGAASYDTSTIWRCQSAVGPGSDTRVCPSLLVEAWQKVTKRHSILSSVFTLHPDGDGFIQIVLDDPVIRVAQIVPELDDPTTTLFNLEKPSFAPGEPQHSFTISQSSTGETICRLDINHVLTDARSESILLEELALAYEGCELPTAPMFSEIVQYNSKTSKAKALATWVANLEGLQPCKFPTSSLHSSAQPIKFGEVSYATPNFQVGPTEFCKSNGILLSSFIHVSWAMVLSYYTGMSDVCFGYDVSGRDAPIEGVDRLVGPLANLLVSRVRLSASANEVLHAASARAGQDLAFQNVSIADIQHHLRLSGRQLFNTSLSIHDNRAERLANKRISFQIVRSEDAHEFDLRLNVLLNQGHPDFVLEFQEPRVSRRIAEEVYGVLMQAIDHLLTTTENHISEHGDSLVSQQVDPTSTLFSQFFTRVGGIERPVAEAFWKAQFANIRGSHFPAIKPTATQERIYNNVSFDLNLDLTGHDFTADVILKAAWALLSSRLLNSDESLFGTATTGHGAGSILPIRIPVNGEKSIGSFLSQIRQQGLDLGSLKRMRLEQVACISDETALACRLQSILVVHPGDESVPEAVAAQEGCTPSLTIEARIEAQSTKIQATFDPAVVTALEVSRLLHQLGHILHQLVDFELRETLLRTVTVTSVDDLNTIWSWNATLPSPVSGCVHDMIVERAKHLPQSVAIDAWDGSMTYGQLDSLSSKLASQLVYGGLGSGSIVPLCFEKSMWMPVAALAVMKAGAASVLIEISHPEQRIRAIIDQVFANSTRKIILSSAHNGTFCERFGSNHVLPVSEEFFVEGVNSIAYEPSLVHPSDVLYVVFTSGTSGSPKGVIITHQNFCSAISYQRDQLGFDTNSRVFDFASNAFDVAWLNLLKTLSSGGCLCIPSAAERVDDLGGALEKYKATVVDLTPSVARTVKPAALSRLATLIFGGEAVSPSDFKSVGGDTQIRVAYGPAECTPTSAILANTASTEGAIGRAAGTCTWIVDLENPDTLAPVGAPGELWIEGPLVGQGYLNNVEKSAQAFVHDPAWLQRGSPDGQHSPRSGRLYRTGDLVRYNGDGSLVFLGRRDSQIKIRGQRVELGDIESHVRRAIGTTGDEHAADTQVAVEYLHLNGSSDKSLVAFISLGKDSSMLSSDDLNIVVQRLAAQATEQLTEELPIYMLPSAYIPIQTMPVTTSGKIDRGQLHQIGSSFSISDVGRLSGKAVQKRAPETETEILMQSIWAKVLQIDRNQIYADDNFFQCGGDSIGAMRLVALARYEELTFTVSDVFQHPVLSDLCRQCRAGVERTGLR
ncbi:non-ribosomal peptide synthetase [Penicillium bovifimosum]|uniref:Non-ribosomal peptide synthetase n=1 Tax=Penicillium bovifimosum TaxID=126998 RepID=A0A9W9H9Q1_9EURO|nr:non-ribosomal peptide synthetase [Penicillium bovifimosum]KAJ5142676.1 non-ribosomal peptide synthetase [Penicillium bovifimosum]